MSNKKLKLSYLLIGVIFFSYVLIRVVNVGATHDEVATIEQLVPRPFIRGILLFSTANNHPINTVLIKILFIITGSNSLFIARLPNLISFIPYLYFFYKITSKNLSPTLGLGCFTLLSCNPFLLDFFGLARGYGISLALMAGSLYFALENIRSFSIKTLSQSLILGSLSVLSIFPMLYYWVSLSFYLNLRVLLRKNKEILTASIKRTLLIGIGTGFLIAPPLLRMATTGGLYYGGINSFYSDTLLTLTKHSLYESYSYPNSSFVHISLNVFIVLLVTTVGLSYFHKKTLSRPRDLFILTTGIIILIITLAHYVAGVRYPIDRVGLFLYPLLILCLVFALAEIKIYLRTGILLTILSGFIYNFTINANTYKTILWDFDAHTQEILDEINAIGEGRQEAVNLQAEWLFEPAIQFYLKRNSYPFVRFQRRNTDEYINPESEYFIFSSKVRSPWTLALRESARLDLEKLNKSMVIIRYESENIVVFNLKEKQPTP